MPMTEEYFLREIRKLNVNSIRTGPLTNPLEFISRERQRKRRGNKMKARKKRNLLERMQLMHSCHLLSLHGLVMGQLLFLTLGTGCRLETCTQKLT